MKKVKKERKNIMKCVSSIRGILASSAHTIIICVILLASVCWAWFSKDISGPKITLQTATYGLQAVVSGNGVEISGNCSGVTGEDNNAVIEVENGKVYDISLSVPKDQSTEYGGYCLVSAGDDLHYTVPIGGKKGDEPNPEKISFRIWIPGTGTSKVEFLPYWGTYPDTLPEKWKNGEILKKEDIIEDGVKYVISGGDITVSSGNSGQ